MNVRPLTVLHAEDDPNDVMLLKRTLAKLQFEHKFIHVADGEQAIEYLRGTGKYANRAEFPFPSMLILDLKMPRKGGLEVLQWLYDHTDCSVIPTIVLTSSAQPSDVKQCYQTAANAYFTKPSNLDDWLHLFRVILEYWQLANVPEPPPQSSCR